MTARQPIPHGVIERVSLKGIGRLGLVQLFDFGAQRAEGGFSLAQQLHQSSRVHPFTLSPA